MACPTSSLVEHPKHPCDQEDDQDRAEADSGPAAIAPTAMPVVSAAAAQQQYENDDEDQHVVALFRFRTGVAAGRVLKFVAFGDHLVACFACDFLRLLGKLFTGVTGLFGDAVDRILQVTGNIVDSVFNVVLVETHDGAPR